MSFKMGSLKFIDSFQFMGSSLEKLVENLYDNEDKHKNFHSMKQYYNDHMDLLCKKGIYPYEWIDNNEKLNHQGLPENSDFYSKLSRSGITDEEYKHAQDVSEKAQDGNEHAQDGYEHAQDGYEHAQDGYEHAQDGYENEQDGCDNAQDGYDNAQDGYANAQDGYANAQD